MYPSQPELDHPTVSRTVHSVVFLISRSTYHTRHRKLPLPAPSQDTPGGNPPLPVPSLVWTVCSLLWTELCCPPNSCVEVLRRWPYLERVVADVMSPDEIIRVARMQRDRCPSTRGTCGQKHWHGEGTWRRSSTSQGGPEGSSPTNSLNADLRPPDPGHDQLLLVRSLSAVLLGGPSRLKRSLNQPLSGLASVLSLSEWDFMHTWPP